MSISGKRILSTLDADGTLTVALAPFDLPAPIGDEVAVQVEAAPINPSDLGLMLGPADVENADYSQGRLVARMPDGAVRAMKARHGITMPVGIECAGTVVQAGEGEAAQALLGKRVACAPGSTFATHALADGREAMILDESVTAEQGASSFVNPMTALAFVETMRRDGFTGIVHTAAASNLGQMLARICIMDGVSLVNIVRSPAQLALLRNQGSEFVIDSTAPDFVRQLVQAVTATGAMVGFDAIGGGKIGSQILTAMEVAASRNEAFSRYGSTAPKKLHIYGSLDLGPTLLSRGFGFEWEVAGWLLTPFLASAGAEVRAGMRARVQSELTNTFASHYKARISLEEALGRQAVAEYSARRTGEKYLLIPV